MSDKTQCDTLQETCSARTDKTTRTNVAREGRRERCDRKNTRLRKRNDDEETPNNPTTDERCCEIAMTREEKGRYVRRMLRWLVWLS